MSGWFKAIAPFMKRFRLARARRIKRVFPDIDNRSITDNGGWLLFWSLVKSELEPKRAGLAREIARVARNYIIQTPAKIFPLELHFLMPFLHWLPRRVGRALVRFSPLGLAPCAMPGRRNDSSTRSIFRLRTNFELCLLKGILLSSASC
jgi:hypothetical protein